MRTPVAFKDLVNKAKSMATRNPDAARKAIDRVEQQINARTGGKYRDKIGKGGDLLGKQLGVHDRRGDGRPADPNRHVDPTRPAPGEEPGPR